MMENSKSRVGPKNLAHADWVQALIEALGGLELRREYVLGRRRPSLRRRSLAEL